MEKIAKHTLNPTRNRCKVFSVGLVVLLFSVSLALPAVVQAASLYFSPSSGSYSVGRSFTVSVYVSSPSQAMNAVSGIITFPSDKLQVTSLSKAGSIVSFWAQEPSFSNITGTITLEGVVLPAGYIGSNGKILDVNFAAKSQGTASLNFSSGSVLAHDGQGTNILAGLGSASYTITGVTTTKAPSTTQTTVPKTPKAVKISSETHPDSNKWYSEDTAIFNWDLTDDITEVRLLISKDPDAKPTISYSPPVDSKTVTNLGKGVWYFYVQLKNEYGWGEISRFRVQIDETSLKPLDIKIDDEGDSYNPQPLLVFEDEEVISNIDFCNITINRISDGEEIYNFQILASEIQEGIYRLPASEPGEYSLTVKAITKDGAYSLTTIDLKILKPVVDRKDLVFYLLVLLLFIFFVSSVIFLALFIIYYRRSKDFKNEIMKTTNETEVILFEALDDLKKKITRQVAKLDGNDVLSKREEEINEELKKAVRESEQMISEKIQHIKKKVDKN